MKIVALIALAAVTFCFGACASKTTATTTAASTRGYSK